MATAPDEPNVPFDLREQLKRIDMIQAQLSKITVEQIKMKPDATPAPITLAIIGSSVGAVLFAAGAAFIKLIG